jgi:hypothetical protein
MRPRQRLPVARLTWYAENAADDLTFVEEKQGIGSTLHFECEWGRGDRRNCLIPILSQQLGIAERNRIMAYHNPTKLRISLWRDFRPERTLAYKASGAPDAKVFQRDDHLQEEVFAWHVSEGVLNGVADDELRAKIAACLTEDFAPALPPSDRACRRVGKFFSTGHRVGEGGMVEQRGPGLR